MLTTSRAIAILPVTNLERARRFYSDTLGLAPVDVKTPEGVALLEAGGGTRVQLLATDEPGRTDRTAVTFEVPDVQREVEELQRRGVGFESYDLPGLRTEHHIAQLESEKAAWFKDSEGNLLCVHQRPG